MLLPLASCANSGLGKTLQDSLAADPRLTETAPDQPGSSPAPTPQTQATLPADFPGEIPRYPGATLQEVVPATNGQPNSEIATVWQTTDASDRVFAFYREQLQTNGWEIAEAPLTSSQGTLVAQRNSPNALQVSVVIAPSSAPSSPTPAPTSSPEDNSLAEPSPNASAIAGTQFTLRYSAGGVPAAQASPNPTTSPEQTESEESEVFLGAEGTSDNPTTSNATSPNPAPSTVVALEPNSYTDLNQTPQDLKPYVTDLAQLGVLNLAPSAKTKTVPTTFSPNKPVSRREYARWLFEANNRLFGDRTAQQIRAANNSAQPAFRDVPRTDPDFAVIQGLAEAGIIPSSLSGDPTVTTFRPEAQLSREIMVLWKVPMDTRQPLPTATLDAVKQTWGFQDAARIDPKAQRAVLADFQNADLSNIRRVFGYTTLFQPKRPVTRAEAAATLWYFGYQGDGVSAQDALKTQ
ncbi:MAG: S-layer homology domain-containing protein [Leptolyngbyaceae cyanobacterium bins.302]|nr:S-layer homology domain-containing protein [Leptolyngbyaceae cyanobacterium bins.302]